MDQSGGYDPHDLLRQILHDRSFRLNRGKYHTQSGAFQLLPERGVGFILIRQRIIGNFQYLDLLAIVCSNNDLAAICIRKAQVSEVI